MSAQPAYAGPLRVERGGLAATPAPVAKMSFYDLQNLFWQLDASERFSGTETRLYFYWLNRLNAGLAGEYWPDEYPRWGKQVEADLGLTDKTLAAARAVLVKRGLLSYREGTKARAAGWGLGKIARNNSGQFEEMPPQKGRKDSGQSAISRNNSDESKPMTPNMSRKDSGQSDEMTPNMSRNNSGLYKEKTEDLNNDKDKDPTVAAGAAAPVGVIEAVEAFTSPLEAQASASHTEGGATDVATSVGDGQKGQKGQKLTQKDKPEPEHWPTFWAAYPRHNDPATALKSFARLTPAEQQLAAESAAAFFARRPAADWFGKEGQDYRPYAATWLNKKLWKELSEPLATPPSTTPTHATHSTILKPGAARHHVPEVTSYGSL